MQSNSRGVDVSFNTIDKLLQDAARRGLYRVPRSAVRGVKSQRVQCNEIWSFVHAKAKNVPTEKTTPEGCSRYLDLARQWRRGSERGYGRWRMWFGWSSSGKICGRGL
jgi:hypothetical protein